MVTNKFIRNVKQNGWKPFEQKIWQRNYYEHIIRNEESLNKIAAYIRNNPASWMEDEYFL
jgi:REP element-mobilizing transposase RayT